MKFCPSCEKTAQRFCLTRYCDESNGRFEILLKSVDRTFDDSCNNTASYFFALIKFSSTFYRMPKSGRKYFVKLYLCKNYLKLGRSKKAEKFMDANISEFGKRSFF